MKLILSAVLLMLSNILCWDHPATNEPLAAEETKGYYSDYFVFIAADEEDSPLVIPIDINWTLGTDSYEVEYKAWYGTEADWPIEYFKKNIMTKKSVIPLESFEHSKTKGFRFNNKDRTIVAVIKGKYEVQIQVPEQEEWVLATSEGDFPTYAFKTNIKVDGRSRSGWMLYERIRFNELKKFDGFGAFYWMPVVIEDKLYHFTQHRGEQTAVKWSETVDGLNAETISKFDFNITKSVSDAKSKRSKIAKAIRIQVPEWDVDIALKSTGEQIGYGGEHPNGLAVYRQSLLQPNIDSKDLGYGMMELILADD